jgi:hypothetical protein
MIDPQLEAILRAAIDVTTIAFVDQKLVVKTPLHGPIQALIEALCGYPPYVELLHRMNEEAHDRAMAVLARTAQVEDDRQWPGDRTGAGGLSASGL